MNRREFLEKYKRENFKRSEKRSEKSDEHEDRETVDQFVARGGIVEQCPPCKCSKMLY